MNIQLINKTIKKRILKALERNIISLTGKSDLLIKARLSCFIDMHNFVSNRKTKTMQTLELTNYAEIDNNKSAAYNNLYTLAFKDVQFIVEQTINEVNQEYADKLRFVEYQLQRTNIMFDDNMSADQKIVVKFIYDNVKHVITKCHKNTLKAGIIANFNSFDSYGELVAYLIKAYHV